MEQQLEPQLPKKNFRLDQDEDEEDGEEEVGVGLLARHSRHPPNGVVSIPTATTSGELAPAAASAPTDGTTSDNSFQEEKAEATAGDSHRNDEVFNENEKGKVFKGEGDGIGNSVYFDKLQGIWKCRHCNWTHQNGSPCILDVQNPNGYLHVAMDAKTLNQCEVFHFKGTKSINGISEIPKILSTETYHQQVKNVEDQNPFGVRAALVEQLHGETNRSSKHFDNAAKVDSNVDLIGEMEEDLTELDVERVLDKQTTHDLYCPNCNSCITRKVILVRRKPKISNIHRKPKRVRNLDPIPNSTGDGHSGETPEMHANVSPTLAPDEQNNDRGREQEAFSCLSCFSLFIPIVIVFLMLHDHLNILLIFRIIATKDGNGCFKIFQFFNPGRWNENSLSPQEISQRANTQSPQEINQRDNTQSTQGINPSENVHSPQEISRKENEETPPKFFDNEDTQSTQGINLSESAQSPQGISRKENTEAPEKFSGNEDTQSTPGINPSENSQSPQEISRKENTETPQKFCDNEDIHSTQGINPSENAQSPQEISQKENTQTQKFSDNEDTQSIQGIEPSENTQSPREINRKENTETPQNFSDNEDTQSRSHKENMHRPQHINHAQSPQHISRSEDAKCLQKISSNENKQRLQDINQNEGKQSPQKIPTAKTNWIFSLFAFHKGKATVEKAGHATLVQSAAMPTQPVTCKEYIDGVALKPKEPGISNIFSSTYASLLDKVEAESRQKKPDADMFQRNAGDNEIEDVEAGLLEPALPPRTEVAPSSQSITQNEHSRGADVGEAHELEILKSIVYGGLIESITSASVVSSAAGAGADTLYVLALGLANVIGGLVIIGHNLRELKNNQPRGASTEINIEEDRYYAVLGQRQNFILHVIVAIVSFLIFGLVPPVVYGFSFRTRDDKDLKLAAMAGASLACIVLLALGKGHVRKPRRTYLRTVLYYVILGILASGISYLVGELIKKLAEQLGLFESSSAVSQPFLETIPFEVGRASY